MNLESSCEPRAARVLRFRSTREQPAPEVLAELIPLAPAGSRAASSAEPIYGVATTLDGVLAAWRLVHDCYRDQGMIVGNAHGVHTTRQAASPGAMVLCAELAGEVVATLSLMRDGGAGLAVDATHARELDAIRASGRRLTEIGLGAHRGQGSSCERLIAIGLDYALRDDFSAVVMAVHPRHAEFYARSFGFEVKGRSRQLGTPKHASVLLYLDRSVFERAPAPRGIELLRANPVPPGFYSGAFSFLPGRLAGTPLSRFVDCTRVC